MVTGAGKFLRGRSSARPGVRGGGAAAGAKPFCFQRRLTPPWELGEGTREQSGLGVVFGCLPLRRKHEGEEAARAAAAVSPLSPTTAGVLSPSVPPAMVG